MQLFIPVLIGLVAGVLGGLLGIGGSLIIIPGMVIYLSHTAAGYQGIDQHLLQAAAMIVNVFVAAPSVIAHYRAGAIMRPIVVWLIPASIVGILSGVALSNSPAFARQNGAYLAMIFCGFLVYVIGYNLHRMRQLPRPVGDEPLRPERWKVALVGLVMGLLAGLLGIGGGAICVPMQQVLLKVSLRKAIANSAATIPFASMIGAVHKNLTLAGHGFEISQSLLLAAMLIPTAIVGSYFGGRLTHVLPRRILRATFVLFLSAVTVLTFSKAFRALKTPRDTRAIVQNVAAGGGRAGGGSGKPNDPPDGLAGVVGNRTIRRASRRDSGGGRAGGGSGKPNDPPGEPAGFSGVRASRRG